MYQEVEAAPGNRFTFYAGMGGNKRRSTGLCRSLYRTAVWLGIYRAWNNRSDYYTASEETAAEGRVNVSGRLFNNPAEKLRLFDQNCQGWHR